MSAGVPRVLPDANVLYSRTLRDWLCLFATRSGPPLFHLRWTEDIFAELLYSLRKNHPGYSDGQIGGVRDRIQSVATTGRISGYTIDPDLDYTDEHDAHVHAAAEHGRIQYVITDDKPYMKFAGANDEILSYETYTSDDFLMLVNKDSPATVSDALLRQIEYHRSRKNHTFNLPSALESAGAPRFAVVIRGLMQTEAVSRALTRPIKDGR